MTQPRGITGFRAFLIVWIGQAISLIGSGMTGFAMTIWAYELTGQATALALVGFFYVTPLILVSPLAGAIIDRSNRKLMMMLSDLSAGAVAIVYFILYNAGTLEIWHLYIGNLIIGTFQAFQWPAYSAAISLMIPKEQFARANGMMQLAEAGSGILAPVLAGAALGFIGLQGVLLFDIISFSVAILTLLLVVVPQPEQSEEGRAARGSLWSESMYGFRYIFERPSLLGLLIVFLIGNFFATIAGTVNPAMILERTGNNELVLGTVQSSFAFGSIAGAILLSVWGGFKRRIHGVLLGWMFGALFGYVLFGLSGNIWQWAITAVIGGLVFPIVNGSSQAIWQAKVSPDVQGRVFSVRRMIAWIVTPLSTLLAGPLADNLMEPAVQPGGWLEGLSQTLYGAAGSGAASGTGMAILIVLCGVGAMASATLGYIIPAIREVETRMPDFAPPAAAKPVESGETESAAATPVEATG